MLSTSINVRENWWGNQQCTNERHRQYDAERRKKTYQKVQHGQLKRWATQIPGACTRWVVPKKNINKIFMIIFIKQLWLAKETKPPFFLTNTQHIMVHCLQYLKDYIINPPSHSLILYKGSSIIHPSL